MKELQGGKLRRRRFLQGVPAAFAGGFALPALAQQDQPRRISKGKQHMVLALYALGKSPAEIRELTGCTKGAMERYIADYEEGAKEADFDGYFGIDLGPKELARLHGLCRAKYGRS